MHGLSALLSDEITCTSLELRTIEVPLKGHFRSAIGSRRSRLALLVFWTDSEGNRGVGENSCRPDPWFNGEFVEGAVSIVRDHIFPKLQRTGRMSDVVDVVEKVRGWPFTIGAVLDAMFDAVRRAGRQDALECVLPDRIDSVPVGISLGIHNDRQAALEAIEAAVAEGYRRVKMKLSPGSDVEILQAVRSSFPDINLAFDANGSFEESHAGILRQIAALDPSYIEQPFSPRRLDLCTKLKQEIPSLRICLDESVTALGDVMVANQIGAIDEVNLKPGRVGGQLEAIKILQFCRESDLPCWIGGMFETGIGRMANLRMASRIENASAHDLSPSSRYFDRDVVHRPVTMNPEGFVDLGDSKPVILHEEAIEHFTTNRIELIPEH